MQSSEIKKKTAITCIAKYGGTNPNKSKAVQEKVILTKFNRYGCIPIGQRFKVGEIYFHSFPELCIYLYCIENNIDIKREPVKLVFIVDDKKYFYIPDFMINDQLVEIKGNQFLAEDGTWINPFDMSEEGIRFNKAKYNCAIENNVRILYTNDYLKYINWFYKNGYVKDDYIV